MLISEVGELFQVDSLSRTWSVLQDVLTDLSAECENLPIEGVSGACYVHKVHSDATFLCRCLHRLQVRCFLVPEINMFVSLPAGHLPGSELHLQEAGEWRHPEPGLLHCTGKRNGWDQQSQLQQRCLCYVSAPSWLPTSGFHYWCRFTVLMQRRDKHNADLHFL